ncbi:MAG: ribonuclease E, partial [Desulfuromonas sp.]
MAKKMLINATHPEENRVAIVEDGILSELDIEIAGHEQTKGNIYKATVVRVEQGLQAAFVDYGAERLGFLQLSEIHTGLYPKKKDDESKGRPRIQELLSRGQELLVQIVKEERGTKGAALTTFLSFPGRFMVLMPGSDTRGMSRKIDTGDERKQLKEALKTLVVPEDIGYIVRTASLGASAEELRLDLDYLLRLYRSILSQAEKNRAPALVYRESNLVMRTIRDYFSTEMDEVLVDDSRIYEETREFFRQLMPDHLKLVKLHQERRPIFARYQIEEQIETIYKNKVSLPSGGSIVIDKTEALVAIDVNSGKMSGETGIEATAYKSNLEAADEVARQLRLRDLGGLVVIDFIDMAKHSHNRDVERRLKDALKLDKARISVGRISQFGLLEMSRQRIKPALAEASYLTCEHCKGSGRIKSPESLALAFLRRIHAAVAKGKSARIVGTVPLEVASYLLNQKRDELVELERRYKTEIQLHSNPELAAEAGELEVIKREKNDAVKVALAEVPLRAAEDEQLVLSRPETEDNLGDEASANSGDEEAPAKKKRRRRRRKKKPAEGEAAANVETPPTTEGESSPAADEPEAATTGSESADDTTQAKRPSRRRGSRGGRKKSSTTTREEDSIASDDVVPAEDTAASETPAEEAPKKPARKRTPRKKADEATTTETPAADETPAEEKPKKPARKRTPRKKADEATTSETPAASETPAEETPKKPARKPAPRKKADEATTAETPAANETPAEETPKKPARKRAPRKKADEATTSETPAVSDTPAEETPKKPARKRAP